MHATPEDAAREAVLLDLFMPLQFFYLREDRILPEVALIEGDEMPEPSRGLLVHGTDMTSKLRAYHESAIGLRVLDRELADHYLIRAVVLEADSGIPVEFGAIGIRVGVFDESLREEILDGSAPLGGLLNEHGFAYASQPKAFFQVKSDPYISHALHCPLGSVLYGRCNALNDKDGITFADIVEILPPLP